MKSLQQHKDKILKSDLPDEVKNDLIEAIERNKADKLKVVATLLRFYGLCRDIYDFFDDKLYE